MPFGSLWLAVVVGSVAVFVVSSVLHMVVRHHRADYKRFGDEAGIGAAIRKDKPSPGYYVLPYCDDMAKMKDPDFRKKYEEGPVAMITVLESKVPAMGTSLVLWFLFCFLVCFVTAYVARHTLSFGQDGMTVFRVTSTIAFLAHGFGSIQESIWKGLPWPNTVRFLIDAFVYSVVIGLAFALLWPAA
jgi:hypothetical protein